MYRTVFIVTLKLMSRTWCVALLFSARGVYSRSSP